MDSSLNPSQLQAFRQNLEADPLARVAAAAVSKNSIHQVCQDPGKTALLRQKFSLEIPTLPACNQEASGRCWIFAGMNLLREKVAKDLKLEQFELSQNYLCFYDHLEKANTFLENILSTASCPLEDRYVSRLFNLPVGDGGWWEYFVGLCLKYGVVPKDAMPETWQSRHTEDMNTLLNMQLRRDALTIRQEAAAGKTPEEIRQHKEAMLSRVYRLLAICLGTPPERFDFEYVDQDHVYHADRNLTPKEFYDRYAGRDLPDIVSILNAPIDLVPYYETCYTRGEESIYGAFQAKRLNLPLPAFKAAVLRQLQAGEPVWFVCDCDYYGCQQDGIWDTEAFDYESLLGLEPPMDKGQLLDLRQCSLNHAMLLTGVNLVDGKPDRWKIQNSWGSDCGRDGYFVMSDAWFDRYVFTASIHRAHLTPEENRCFDREPLVLTPWNVLA